MYICDYICIYTGACPMYSLSVLCISRKIAKINGSENDIGWGQICLRVTVSRKVCVDYITQTVCLIPSQHPRLSLPAISQRGNLIERHSHREAISQRGTLSTLVSFSLHCLSCNLIERQWDRIVAPSHSQTYRPI